MKQILLVIVVCHSVFAFGQYTSIPDPNFEQALINLGYDNNLDGQVLTNNINTVTSLDVSWIGINNLTGINDFINLDTLDCRGNQLANLNVSQNSNLNWLDCSENQLTYLNLTQNISLVKFWSYNNLLTSLDVSQNVNLTNLSITRNNLTSLDVSQNILLTHLNVTDNNIQNIDLSQNPLLELLDCSVNLLTSIDVSQNSAINNLSFDYSPLLTCVNIKNGNNTIITTFWGDGNPELTCIEVDDVSFAIANWTNVDPQTSFNINCNYSSNCFSTSNLIENGFSGDKELVKIVNLLGQEVEYAPNTLLIYQYSNGTTEKMFTVEK